MPTKAKLQPTLPLFASDPEGRKFEVSDALGVTFRDSNKLPIHGWYPYVEGFSARYIEGLIHKYGSKGLVYDPFGGSGTVNLVAAMMGLPSAFSEANPFMRFVAETKINARSQAQKDRVGFARCVSHLKLWAYSDHFHKAVAEQELSDYFSAFNKRDFFEVKDISELKTLRDGVFEVTSGNRAFRDILLLALSSVTVACSNMTRRADLRRRRADEYLGRVVDVRNAVFEKLARMERDICIPTNRHASALFMSNDCRKDSHEMHGKAGLILTSPPYLNGTNYIRNTKLELWLLGFIQSERELSDLNKDCMVCGINNVIKSRPAERLFELVESAAKDLDIVSPDKRIPALVRGYFSDMFLILQNCSSYLNGKGKLVLDIGDSRFYGVQVATDDLLIVVAKEAGLKLIEKRLIARRHSRDKTALKQMELIFSNAD